VVARRSTCLLSSASANQAVKNTHKKERQTITKVSLFGGVFGVLQASLFLTSQVLADGLPEELVRVNNV
jgi:hypothetical protein